MDMERITPHFTWAEAHDRTGAGMPFDVECNVREFAKFLERVREEYGHRMIIDSWYRNPGHPEERGKPGGPGAHARGLAVDVRVGRGAALALVAAVLKVAPKNEMGVPKVGLGLKQTGRSRFVHIDRWSGDHRRPRPHIWSY